MTDDAEGTLHEDWWPTPQLVGQMADLAAALVADRHRAEEVLSDALVVMWRKRALVAKADNIHAYSRRILTTTFLNMVAADKRRQRLNLRFANQVATVGTTRETDQIEQRDVIRRALAEIPVKERTAIVLRYYADLADEVIAATMDCSESSVRSYLSRGRARLAQIISDTDSVSSTERPLP